MNILCVPLGLHNDTFFFFGDFDRFRELDLVDVAMTGWSVVGRVAGSMGACLGVMSVCATVANIGTLR